MIFSGNLIAVRDTFDNVKAYSRRGNDPIFAAVSVITNNIPANYVAVISQKFEKMRQIELKAILESNLSLISP